MQAAVLSLVALGFGAGIDGYRGALSALVGIGTGLIAIFVLTLQRWASVPGGDEPVFDVLVFAVTGLILCLALAVALSWAWRDRDDQTAGE